MVVELRDLRGGTRPGAGSWSSARRLARGDGPAASRSAVRTGGRAVARTVAVAGLAVAALALPAPVAPAQAAAPGPQGQLWLSVSGEDIRDRAGALRSSAVLTCVPDGGTHPRRAAACAALRQVEGRITALPVRRIMCTKVYAPVVAEAVGNWGAERVRYRKTFANACEMEARTGAVFALDPRH